MTLIELVRDKQSYEAKLRQLLETVDQEFVPPLTDESRADMSRMKTQAGGVDIDTYVERCLNRPLIGVFDGSLIGFLSFDIIQEGSIIDEYTPTNHVEILVVDTERRGEGLGTEMYRYLLEDIPESHCLSYVSTKTWECNEPHIAILKKFDFELVNRIPNDRGPGIDTVYYARPHLREINTQ